MQRHLDTLKGEVLLTAVLLGLLSIHVAHARAQPAAGDASSASQVFSVALRFQPESIDSRSGCSRADDRAPIEAIRYQFLLSTASSPPSLSVMPAELATILGAVGARAGTAVLVADGADWVFDSITIGMFNASLRLSQGRLRLSSEQRADGSPRLEIIQVHMDYRSRPAPDILAAPCVGDATGLGVRDQSPPVARLAVECIDPPGEACEILSDAIVGVYFSKIVRLDDARTRISATTDDGGSITLLPVPDADPSGYVLRFRGAWPLGQQVTFRIAAGLHDLADNASTEGTERRHPVVPDPGDFDAAGNRSFETGDLTGYTVRRLPCPYAPFTNLCGNTPPLAPEVVTDFRGITPSEGKRMLAVGSLAGCSEFALTARLQIPAGMTRLVIDANFVSTPVFGIAVLSSSLSAGAELETAQWRSPSPNTSIPADDKVMQTGWQPVHIPVGPLAGSPAVLTLRLLPFGEPHPPIPCTPGVLLLDNLRFE